MTPEQEALRDRIAFWMSWKSGYPMRDWKPTADAFVHELGRGFFPGVRMVGDDEVVVKLKRAPFQNWMGEWVYVGLGERAWPPGDASPSSSTA